MTTNLKEIQDFVKERYVLLESQGIILSNELQDRLIELSVLPHKGEYYLEDILKLIPLLSHPSFFKMIFDNTKTPTIILEDGSLPSEQLRAIGNSFVNAAGKFIIEAIERGFVKTAWQDLLKDGLETSEYYIRSRMLNETRNWIGGTFEKMVTKKPRSSWLGRFFNF